MLPSGRGIFSARSTLNCRTGGGDSKALNLYFYVPSPNELLRVDVSVFTRDYVVSKLSQPTLKVSIPHRAGRTRWGITDG